jgi:hypothetical protein
MEVAHSSRARAHARHGQPRPSRTTRTSSRCASASRSGCISASSYVIASSCVTSSTLCVSRCSGMLASNTSSRCYARCGACTSATYSRRRGSSRSPVSSSTSRVRVGERLMILHASPGRAICTRPMHGSRRTTMRSPLQINARTRTCIATSSRHALRDPPAGRDERDHHDDENDLGKAWLSDLQCLSLGFKRLSSHRSFPRHGLTSRRASAGSWPTVRAWIRVGRCGGSHALAIPYEVPNVVAHGFSWGLRVEGGGMIHSAAHPH